MSTTLEQAERLKAALIAAAGDTVDLVTLDGTGVKVSTRAAIVIFPPAVEFPNWGERDTAFTLAIVAGPADRPLIAWAAMDAVLDALEAEQVNIQTARPGTFNLAGSGNLPAYEIILNPL